MTALLEVIDILGATDREAVRHLTVGQVQRLHGLTHAWSQLARDHLPNGQHIVVPLRAGSGGISTPDRLLDAMTILRTADPRDVLRLTPAQRQTFQALTVRWCWLARDHIPGVLRELRDGRGRQ